ncbi:MAG: hypothetical protein AVDCRST_MAG93-9154, partial [uncultured Chloroflexia bacterium]
CQDTPGKFWPISSKTVRGTAWKSYGARCPKPGSGDSFTPTATERAYSAFFAPWQHRPCEKFDGGTTTVEGV